MEHLSQNKGIGFEVLQRYHEGTLSAAERHALEKAALEDPFLADALEGYAFTATAGADVKELQKRLEAKTEKQNKKGLLIAFSYKKWLRVAVVVAALFGAGWGSYQLLTSKNETGAVAKDATETSTADSINSDAALATPFSNATADSSMNETKAAATKPEIKSQKVAKKALSPQQTTAPTVSEESTVATSENDVATVHTFSRTASAIVSDSSKKEVLLFQGKVVDAKGNAVPFATIASTDKKLITTTDLNGSFSLPAPDTTVTVTASAVGYQALSQQLTAPAPNVFVLPESTASLNEVVVTAFGKKNEKRARKSYLESGSLEPAEGWQRFDDYIAQNLQPPETEDHKILSGDVTLAFDVSPTGEPVNIKIIQSVCTPCNAEAIRLLQSGPKWKKGKKGKVKIRF